MKNLLFTLWMLLFPIAWEFGIWIEHKTRQKPRLDSALPILTLILEMVLYLGVGYLLYNK